MEQVYTCFRMCGVLFRFPPHALPVMLIAVLPLTEEY